MRGIGRVEAAEQAAVDPELAQWKVRTRERYDSDGNLVITIVTRPQYAPVIKAGLAATRADLDRTAGCGQPVPAGTPEPGPATDGDALLALAEQALATEKQTHPDAARRRRPQLTPQVDPLSGWARQVDGELLPPGSLRAVLNTLPGRQGPGRLRPVTPADLRRHDLGRTRREVSLALRELVGHWTVNAAASPAAPVIASCTRTTSSTGATAARPTWRTWCWSAVDTTL